MAAAKVTASTQAHLDILDVVDDLVLLKNGGAACVIQTTAVNFDLLSEREQDAMIGAFGNLLNSLSFPVQIIIRSKKMDITAYLERLNQVETEQPNPQLREKVVAYRNFIQELITKNEVLDKRFYIIVPYYSSGLPSSSSPTSWLDNLLGRKQKRIRIDKRYLLDKAKIQINPKRDSLIKELSRVGIKSKQLNTQELVELFYEIYNPGGAPEQKPKLNPEEYTSPMVEPAVAI
ncbi:MAG: hypothetical protein Q8N84_02755 [bacterium]|nr:hypothetical protein [bacterium]